MEVDIGQQWRGNRPLGRASLRGYKFSFFHHACLQPLADKAVYTTITDAVWFAIPFLSETFTLYSLPISRRTNVQFFTNGGVTPIRRFHDRARL
jgi:hypothetical protein